MIPPTVILVTFASFFLFPNELECSPKTKGRPKSIPHHAAHLLADPNHNSPQLVTADTLRGGHAVPANYHGPPNQLPLPPHSGNQVYFNNVHAGNPNVNPNLQFNPRYLVNPNQYISSNQNNNFNNPNNYQRGIYGNNHPGNYYLNNQYAPYNGYYPNGGRYPPHRGAYNHPGYYNRLMEGKPYGALNIDGSYYVRLPDGTVEDAATVAAKLGYIPRTYNDQPYNNYYPRRY